MPSSNIPVPTYSSDESIGSSVSLVILSNTEMEITDVLAVTLEVEAATIASHTDILDLTTHFDTKFDPPEDSSSSDHTLVAPGVSLFYDYELDFESEPLEVPSKEDAPEPQEATVARWRAVVMARSSSSSFVSTPPTSLYIVPALRGLHRLPIRLRDSSSRHHHETRIEDSTETGYDASVKDYTRTDIKSGAKAIIKATAEVVAKLDLPLILPKQMVAERLDNHNEVIQERLETAEAEMIVLHDTVRSLEISVLAIGHSFVASWIMYQLVIDISFIRIIIMPATRSGMTPKAIEEVIAQRVALETYEANRNVKNLVENEEDNRNGNRGRNSNGHRNRNRGGNGNGNGGGNRNGNGNKNDWNGNHGDNAGGAMQAAREGTYKKFLNCLPLNFKEIEGAVGLTKWFE
ncbi:hypothetical protein Tco_0451241 [Tanacetum coccineum]